MSPRAALAHADRLPLVRQSARVSTVAALLDDTPSQIRKMIRRGELDAHREGKRGLRVFLDSVEAWQRRSAIPADPTVPKPPPKHTRASRAAHNEAVAYLDTLGLL